MHKYSSNFKENPWVLWIDELYKIMTLFASYKVTAEWFTIPESFRQLMVDHLTAYSQLFIKSDLHFTGCII